MNGWWLESLGTCTRLETECCEDKLEELLKRKQEIPNYELYISLSRMDYSNIYILVSTSTRGWI